VVEPWYFIVILFYSFDFSAQLKKGPCFLLETLRQRSCFLLSTKDHPAYVRHGELGKIFLVRASEILEMGLELLAESVVFQSGGCSNACHRSGDVLLRVFS
jgi:hypothetical protein